jgi:superfamily II DNA/RNA helicase
MLTAKLTQQYLENLGIKALNEMQQQTIAEAKNQQEIVLLSNTGSGKTIAFLFAMLQNVKASVKKTQALIVTPSRELAQQIESVLKQMKTGLKISICYGGHKREIEENNLREAPHIIIGTAGRLADHLRRHNIRTEDISNLIIDEYDKSLELGFLDEMSFIVESLTELQNKLLTSATEADSYPDFLRLKNPFVLNHLKAVSEEENKLRIFTVASEATDKLETLYKMLCDFKNTSTIIFCNHRDAVERTSAYIHEQKIVSVFYHGGMEQLDREVALSKFRNGTSNVLVTTDLAARGLDIAFVRNIVHYHLPNTMAEFTHRNGRTARMHETGNVYVIYNEKDDLPNYITETSKPYNLPERTEPPMKPAWSTLFINAGKKDKINKGDIAGFFMQKGQLRKEEVGIIDVKDFTAFVAIRKSKVSQVLELIKEEKIKRMKIKITVAK